MKDEERSIGALLAVVVALGLLAVAFSSAWYHYEFSTGRQTPPGGPQPAEVTGVERDTIAFYSDRWEGDVEPTDAAMAQRALDVMQYGLFAAGGLLALALLGELPWVARYLRRPVCLVFLGLGLGGLATAAVVAWVWLPGSLAGFGVDSPFTARLEEPSGYTRTMLDWGWYATALAGCATFTAALFKFQAGSVDPERVQQMAAEASR